jgi:hypothetical protein
MSTRQHCRDHNGELDISDWGQNEGLHETQSQGLQYRAWGVHINSIHREKSTTNQLFSDSKRISSFVPVIKPNTQLEFPDNVLYNVLNFSSTQTPRYLYILTCSIECHSKVVITWFSEWLVLENTIHLVSEEFRTSFKLYRFCWMMLKAVCCQTAATWIEKCNLH